MDKKQLIVAVLTGIAVFAVIAWLLDPEKVLIELARAKPEFLLLALVVECLSISALTLRWQVFAGAAGHEPSFSSAAAMVVAGIAAANVVPSGRMGGEPLKAYFLKKHGARGSAGLAATAMEKASELTIFSTLTGGAVFWSAFVLHLPWQVTAMLCAAFVILTSATTALLYVTLHRKIKAKWLRSLLAKYKFIGDHIPQIREFEDRIEDSLDNYYSAASRIATRGTMARGLALSALFWSLEMLRAYFLFLAFNVNAQFTVIASAYVLANILITLPLPPGIVEGAMIVIYSSSALNTVTAGTVTLIDRLISFWLVILAGVPAMWYLGVHKRK